MRYVSVAAQTNTAPARSFGWGFRLSGFSCLNGSVYDFFDFTAFPTGHAANLYWLRQGSVRHATPDSGDTASVRGGYFSNGEKLFVGLGSHVHHLWLVATG
ncbi:hypothetical protein PVV74_13755 [Roseovarius sp. SK2]|nr:hypothetical protein [Roseovarius sp. SK2]MDD9726530.1 hypothetical protein [Roseovarius sp. SK2]